MTVREAFGKAFGEEPSWGDTCHIAFNAFRQESYAVMVCHVECVELTFEDGTQTYGRGGTYRGFPDGWDLVTQQGIMKADISDRPAESFRGFFGKEYDAVLDEVNDAP